ncbi:MULTISPECIES: hypothetical protein [unclassified Crossiella]|uniref:phage terminase small subunit n=1 Tax=unclassified Crossiella TaxID=2620835 RepID=UPI001FFFFC3B|nr:MULTISPECIES: hypothetical protein [unclassified Crossiella]MCK2237718.1 hypothetical protein [Crossiella sp. S99.2]MCK2255004.1 hypothetical protein [Crossiella sp. S99.1]
MAITGRPPSERPRNRNAKVHDWTLVDAVPFAGPSPELPELDDGWHPQTLAWWGAVRSMPHCRLWTDTDWQFAIETALLSNEFWHGEPARAAELRLRAGKLGITHEDRLKLRIRYVDPPSKAPAVSAAPAEVTRLDERRRRLAGAP